MNNSVFFRAVEMKKKTQIYLRWELWMTLGSEEMLLMLEAGKEYFNFEKKSNYKFHHIFQH